MHAMLTLVMLWLALGFLVSRYVARPRTTPPPPVEPDWLTALGLFSLLGIGALCVGLLAAAGMYLIFSGLPPLHATVPMPLVLLLLLVVAAVGCRECRH